MLRPPEVRDATAANRPIGYDLLYGLALFALAMREQSGMHIEREIRRHDNPAARRFRDDTVGGSDLLNVQQWCQENAERCNLGLTSAPETVFCSCSSA